MENAALKLTHVSHIPTSQQQLLTQFILQTHHPLSYPLRANVQFNLSSSLQPRKGNQQTNKRHVKVFALCLRDSIIKILRLLFEIRFPENEKIKPLRFSQSWIFPL